MKAFAVPFRVEGNIVWRHAALVAFVTALALTSLFLHSMRLSTLAGGFLFSFSLLGILWPARLLEAYLFFLALGQRDFTYTAISMGGGGDASFSIYISEWVLLILLLAALPRLKETARKYPVPIALFSAYFAAGAILFILTFLRWSPMAAVRDFALVYYSLFAVAVLAHVREGSGTARLVIAIILGTIPNIVGEMSNYLYGTLPLTPEQKNLSMRNSFYYLAGVGYCLPFLPAKREKFPIWPILYCIPVYILALLYSYSKTAMLSLVFLNIIYFAPRVRKLPVSVLAAVAIAFIVPFLFTPFGKTFPFASLFSESTMTQDPRSLLWDGAARDFTEHPYGIGFGAPIFGEHSHTLVLDVEGYHALHNSYLSVLRRIGIEGFAIFTALLGCACFFSCRAYFSFPEHSATRKMALGILFAWISCAFFSYAHVVLEGPFMGAVFWCLAGCMFVLGREGVQDGCLHVPEPAEIRK